MITGYIGNVCLMILMGELFIFMHGVVSLLFVSMCLHHRAFCGIFRQLIGEWTRDRTESHDRQFICRLIRFHISVKRLRTTQLTDTAET